MKLICILSFLLTGIVSSAQAATVSLQFSGAPTGAQIESGYSYVNGAAYNLGGGLLLHDDSGGQSSATFTPVSGGFFDAKSVDMWGIQRLFVTGVQSPSQLFFNNFQWSGYRNGALVASDTGSLSGGSIANYLFNASFTGLSYLRLNLLAPGIQYTVPFTDLFIPSQAGQAYCVAYCSSVSIDNLVLSDAVPAAVPLPAGFALLLGALGFGTFVGRRRSSGKT